MKSHTYGSEYSIVLKKVERTDMGILEKFQCESGSIRSFVQRGCLTSKGHVSYIFIDEENDIIIGFCSIRCNGISTLRFDDEDNEYLTTVPTIEITYFAIDERYRKLPFDENSTEHQTLSQFLFLKMLGIISEISQNNVGATHICLYSVYRAQNFYKRCGFQLFKKFMQRDNDPKLGNCIPMFAIIEK